MNFDTSTIKNIAQLARLAVSDDQAQHLAKDFDKIITLVEKMQQSNTDDIKPMSHPFDNVQPLRTDQVTVGNQRQLMQATAPQIVAGFYTVPQFLETE